MIGVAQDSTHTHMLKTQRIHVSQQPLQGDELHQVEEHILDMSAEQHKKARTQD